MTLFSILVVLVLEQFRPLRRDNPVYGWIVALAARVERSFNAGRAEHGRLGWLVMMSALVAPTLLVHWLLAYAGPLAQLAWTVLIVYLTLGFRHYSHYFSSIQIALNNGDLMEARRLLAEWSRTETAELDARDIARLAVERSLVTTHRNVFGVFFWLLAPIGPAGAVLYRVAEYLARAWSEPAHLENEAFGQFARRAFRVIDWVPARLTAIAFAIVGNFEDAVYAWRNFARRWSDESTGIILSAGGGAMGVRLGTPTENASSLPPTDVGVIDTPPDIDVLPGEEPSLRALQSTVGLIWRALLLWILVLLMISVANWLG
ncbi:MAG: CobD/CbiB family protein [Burkholderiaceae bacterium]|nr:CobD/CbiB family protein [Burkholderiaceae bacterium]